ncbi:Ribosomal RNA-processing protein 17 [Fusarium oxysporum f. sp. albedinis]|nr:Ribosomal RNA-processing protein 17 [Fusarium oxysporum f. sp. albedinis]
MTRENSLLGHARTISMSSGSIWEPPRSSPLGLDPEPTSSRGRVVPFGGGMADDLHLMNSPPDQSFCLL